MKQLFCGILVCLMLFSSAAAQKFDGLAQTPPMGWKNYSISGDLKVRDLWTQKNLGTSGTPYSGVVPPHDVVLLRLSKE